MVEIRAFTSLWVNPWLSDVSEVHFLKITVANNGYSMISGVF